MRFFILPFIFMISMEGFVCSQGHSAGTTLDPDPHRYSSITGPVPTERLCIWYQTAGFIPWADLRALFPSPAVPADLKDRMDQVKPGKEDLASDAGENGLEEGPGFDKDILIDPRPADDRIFVSGKNITGEMDVSVYDADCKLMIRKTIMAGKDEIDIAGLGQGMYIVRALNDDYYKVNVFVK